jgi:hypothetical protein
MARNMSAEKTKAQLPMLFRMTSAARSPRVKALSLRTCGWVDQRFMVKLLVEYYEFVYSVAVVGGRFAEILTQ